MTTGKAGKPLRRRLVDFLGLRRNIAALLIMVVLVGMGEKMAERFLPIYLLALGGTTLSVGLLNGMDNLLSALYSFPGGYLSDRLGHKRALLLFNLVAMLGYVIVIAFPVWQAVIIGAVFFLSWTAISLPATMSLIASALPTNKRTMGVSLHSLVRRIPMALGPVVGGVLISAFGEREGVRLAFVAAFVLGFVALVLQQILVEDKKDPHTAPVGLLAMRKHMPPGLRNLLVSDILVRFCEQIPYAFVVIWCIKNVGITPVEFGLLTTVEMVTAMLVYIPVAYLADKSAKKPLVLVTFLNFTLFPIVLFFSRSLPLLIVAFIVRGLKEFGEPTRKALIMDLAPEGQKAGMFGFYYLIRDIIVSAAAFGGAFLWNISPATNLFAAAGFGLIGALYFALMGRDLSGATAEPQQR